MQCAKALHVFASIVPGTLFFLLFSIKVRVVGPLQDCQVIQVLRAVFRVPFVSHTLIPIGLRVCNLQNTGSHICACLIYELDCGGANRSDGCHIVRI